MQSEDPLKAGDVKPLQDVNVSSMCGPGFAAVHQCGNTNSVVNRYFGLNREISVKEDSVGKSSEGSRREMNTSLHLVGQIMGFAKHGAQISEAVNICKRCAANVETVLDTSGPTRLLQDLSLSRVDGETGSAVCVSHAIQEPLETARRVADKSSIVRVLQLEDVVNCSSCSSLQAA